MVRFVLVHGAYHGGWCWDRLVPRLKDAGVEAIAPDLPGHGLDATPSKNLTLGLYADRIAEVIRGQDGRVTLVGHSMAGAVISEVAERVPDRIARLVYLTAYIPGNGESIVDWARRDVGTHARSDKVEYEHVPCLTLTKDMTRDAFYQDATPEDLDWVYGNLRPEPLAIFRQALTLTPENFGRVPRDYISCRGDRAITPALQDAMLGALPARRVWDMDCGHSPFVVYPHDLADVLMDGEVANI